MERVRIVMVDATPSPDSPGFSEFGGATINVYTTELSEIEAVNIAQREVAEAGWHLQTIEDNFLLTREDLSDMPADGMGYFEQALLDGIVLVIHTYPATPQDGDRIH